MTKELIERLLEIPVNVQDWKAIGEIKDAIESLQVENERAKSAIKTLEQLGYTNHGGEFWKPPIGKAPDFDLIDSIRAERDALAAKLEAVGSKEPWMVAAIDAAKGGQ